MAAWAVSSADGILGSFVSPPETERSAGAAELSDAQLMQRFGNGDAEAFRFLYLRYRDRLYRYTLRLAASPAEADEIFQDVWLAVIHGHARYKPTAAFVTYLFTIAHRRMINVLHRQGRRLDEAMPADELDRIADEASRQPHEIMLQAQNRDALNAAIARLPLLQREAFLLQAEGGMSLDEIGEATTSGRETVKSRLRYAYARLRRELGEGR
jgi:RNA polymerase sigma-70 factor (ECF subfamily)